MDGKARQRCVQQNGRKEAMMSDKRGTLYGVSVGPGDPELLTIKAVKALEAADVIAAPNIGHGRQTALAIVKDHIGGKPLVDCSTPMLRERAKVLEAYDVVSDKLAALLDEGKDVAFVCLGDIGVYSTYYYLHERLVARGYHCEVIPGITSFCAAAAQLGQPLCEGPEQLRIVPVIAGDVQDAIVEHGTTVFMKSGKDLVQLRRALDEAQLTSKASLVANCGLEDQALYPKLADVPQDMSDYFTLVLLRQE